MVTLYGNQISGNCYKVRLLLTQAEVPFRVVEVDVTKGEQRTPEFLRKNPDGKVPLVELQDGRFLAESGAILHHFAQGTALWPESDWDRSRVLQWMFFEQYSHEPYVAVARFWCRFLNAADRYREALKEKHERGYRALDVMERHLTDESFMAAGRYTIADIALYAYTHVAHEGLFSLERYPAIGAWFQRVVDQPRHITLDHVCTAAS